jgi:hypothetical protein
MSRFFYYGITRKNYKAARGRWTGGGGEKKEPGDGKITRLFLL